MEYVLKCNRYTFNFLYINILIVLFFDILEHVYTLILIHLYCYRSIGQYLWLLYQLFEKDNSSKSIKYNSMHISLIKLHNEQTL